MAATFFLLVGESTAERKPSFPITHGPSATVIRVVDGDTVVLGSAIDGANQVRLVGIQAPKLPLGRPNFAKWPLADESKDYLEKLVVNRTVTLAFGGRRMDRHGRLLAHLHDQNGRWIQGAILRQGMARVYSFSDNRSLISEMLSEERSARRESLGIWADPYYAVRKANTPNLPVNGFQVVEGIVRDVAKVRRRVYLNFGANWRTDFTVTLNPKTVRLFDREKVSVGDLEGKTVRVRGWLKSLNGPMITATHPEQIEVLGE